MIMKKSRNEADNINKHPDVRIRIPDYQRLSEFISISSSLSFTSANLTDLRSQKMQGDCCMK